MNFACCTYEMLGLDTVYRPNQSPSAVQLSHLTPGAVANHEVVVIKETPGSATALTLTTVTPSDAMPALRSQRECHPHTIPCCQKKMTDQNKEMDTNLP
jgi:hypothetical protein